MNTMKKDTRKNLQIVNQQKSSESLYLKKRLEKKY